MADVRTVNEVSRCRMCCGRTHINPIVMIVYLTSPSISRLAECGGGATHHKRQIKLFAERKDVINIVTHLDARG